MRKISIGWLFAVSALAVILVGLQMPVVGQDPGWPRQKSGKEGSITYYQPQIDSWKDHSQIEFRTAFSMTPTGGKQIVGVALVKAQTDVDVDSRMVIVHDLQITETHFSAVDESTRTKMEALVRKFLPSDSSLSISLDRLVASVDKPEPIPTVSLKNDPPIIFSSTKAAILLHTDGEAVLTKLKDADMDFVVNTNFPVFRERDKKNYFLYTGKQWLIAPNLQGPWSRTTTLPKDMNRVKADKQWAGLASAIPPRPVSDPVPVVFYASSPAEVISFQGAPVYAAIKGTKLVFATNSDSDLFVDTTSNTYYYLTAGRWFRSGSLQGPWTFATSDLPADFANIPADSKASRVLSSVPGTDEAKDAVLLAQVPTTVVVDPAAAAAQAKVTYNGEPNFKPIEGTSMFYAINTAEKVIRVGGEYYLCLNGIWFLSSAATGPWTTAKSVPAAIYTIPASSPVYNVTYVKQETTSSGSVQSSYTAGYLGSFIVGVGVGAVIWGGTGYYYPPYFYYPLYGYPIYHHYPATYGYGAYYNHATGTYGAFHGVYGPYRGATGWAGYNPYTGTYSRGGTVYGPYGSRTAAGAYNPYTGTRAATRQGSSPYGHWGSTVVRRGGEAIQTGHVSSGGRTIAGARSTTGAAAIGGSGYRGSGGAIRTSDGDMYAGKNGEIYKNTGDGWQQHNGSDWESVNTPQPNRTSSSTSRPNSSARPTTTSTNRPSTTGRSMESNTYNRLNADMKSRQRGATQTRSFQNSQRGGLSRSSGGSSRGGGRSRR